MLSSKPRMTTCIIDGAAVTLNYYPDTQDLRISDAYGACIYKAKWLAPWATLHASIRYLSWSGDAGLNDAAMGNAGKTAEPCCEPKGSVALDLTAIAR